MKNCIENESLFQQLIKVFLALIVQLSSQQVKGQVISDGGNGRSVTYFPKGPDPSSFIQLHCLGSGSLSVQVPDPLHSLNVNTLNTMSAGTKAQVVCKI